MDTLIEVQTLTETEKGAILNVLQRDEQLQATQGRKISQLKLEIQALKKKSILRAGDDLTKMCARCKIEMGFIFNRGYICPGCRFKVCKMCQEIMFNGSWLCNLCYKQRQLRWLTGEWSGSFEQRPLRKWSSGTDLLKASFRVFAGASTESDIDIGEGSGQSSPRKETSNGMAVGSDHDRGDARGRQDAQQQQRVEFPQENDQRKLSQLFDLLRTKTLSTSTPPSTKESKETSIKRVSTRRYSESDTDSSSSSDIDDTQSVRSSIESPEAFSETKHSSKHSVHSQSREKSVSKENFVSHHRSKEKLETDHRSKEKLQTDHRTEAQKHIPSRTSSEHVDKVAHSASNIETKVEHVQQDSNQTGARSKETPKIVQSDDQRTEFPGAQSGPDVLVEAEVEEISRRPSETIVLESKSGLEESSKSENVGEDSSEQLTPQMRRSSSPYSVSMDSIPSSHPSPTLRRSGLRDSMSDRQSFQGSSDTDSVSKLSHHDTSEFSGTESSQARDGGSDDEFVVEELSKVRFRRVTKKAATLASIAKGSHSPGHSPQKTSGTDTYVDVAQENGGHKLKGSDMRDQQGVWDQNFGGEAKNQFDFSTTSGEQFSSEHLVTNNAQAAFTNEITSTHAGPHTSDITSMSSVNVVSPSVHVSVLSQSSHQFVSSPNALSQVHETTPSLTKNSTSGANTGSRVDGKDAVQNDNDKGRKSDPFLRVFVTEDELKQSKGKFNPQFVETGKENEVPLRHSSVGRSKLFSDQTDGGSVGSFQLSPLSPFPSENLHTRPGEYNLAYVDMDSDTFLDDEGEEEQPVQEEEEEVQISDENEKDYEELMAAYAWLEEDEEDDDEESESEEEDTEEVESQEIKKDAESQEVKKEAESLEIFELRAAVAESFPQGLSSKRLQNKDDVRSEIESLGIKQGVNVDSSKLWHFQIEEQFSNEDFDDLFGQVDELISKSKEKKGGYVTRSDTESEDSDVLSIIAEESEESDISEERRDDVDEGKRGKVDRKHKDVLDKDLNYCSEPDGISDVAGRRSEVLDSVPLSQESRAMPILDLHKNRSFSEDDKCTENVRDDMEPELIGKPDNEVVETTIIAKQALAERSPVDLDKVLSLKMNKSTTLSEDSEDDLVEVQEAVEEEVIVAVHSPRALQKTSHLDEIFKALPALSKHSEKDSVYKNGSGDDNVEKKRKGREVVVTTPKLKSDETENDLKDRVPEDITAVSSSEDRERVVKNPKSKSPKDSNQGNYEVDTDKSKRSARLDNSTADDVFLELQGAIDKAASKVESASFETPSKQDDATMKERGIEVFKDEHYDIERKQSTEAKVNQGRESLSMEQNSKSLTRLNSGGSDSDGFKVPNLIISEPSRFVGPRTRSEITPPSSPELRYTRSRPPSVTSEIDSPRSESYTAGRFSPRAGSESSVSQDDSGHVSSGSMEMTPEHRRTDSGYSQSSLQSTLSTVTDRSSEEDIDNLVASAKARNYGSHGNLLSVIADSRESIASFYSDAGDIAYSNIPVTGEILFGLNYNYKTGMLEVAVKQCKDIAAVDTRRKRSDPYVKTYLLPDKTRSGKRKTKVKKHTLCPIFDETLRYSISKSELENRTLWLTVWHNDRFGRNDFLGEVTINFDYYKFDDPSPKWYPLQERIDAQPASSLTYKGDVILSIRYIPPEKVSSPARKGKQKQDFSGGKGQLHVHIKEARNLTAVRSNGFSDPFCKGYLLPERHRSSKQKTPVVKKDCNPSWNYTMVFEDVSILELRERSLELTIWDYEKLASNDFLGGVRLNLGTGMSQGRNVEWMDAKGEEMSMWQAMLDRPNIWIDGTLMLRPNMDKRKY